MTDASKLTRITVNLVPRAAAALELATAITGNSKTDDINRALQVYAWAVDVHDHGGVIMVQDQDGMLQRIAFL